ncbi:hypothetical protein Tco_0502877 [Tanacetum coccineum]
MSNIRCCGLEHLHGQCRPFIWGSRSNTGLTDPVILAATQIWGVTDWHDHGVSHLRFLTRRLSDSYWSRHHILQSMYLNQKLDGYVHMYIPEPEHPEDLVPAEDEAPIEAYITEVASAPPPPPSFLPSLIRPPHTRAAMAQMRVAAPSTYHPLLPSGTPPLLPIPLPAPSTSRRADIPEADTPPRKRLLLNVTPPNWVAAE